MADDRTDVRPRFNAEINLGHIGAVVASIVAIVWMTGDLRAQMQLKDAQHETRIIQLEDAARQGRQERLAFQDQVGAKLDKLLDAVARLQAEKR
jgi:hypothetical protein